MHHGAADSCCRPATRLEIGCRRWAACQFCCNGAQQVGIKSRRDGLSHVRVCVHGPPTRGLLECGQGSWWHGNTERGEGEFSLMYQASILILVSSKANNYISILGFAFDVVQYPPHLETNVHRSLFYLDKLLKNKSAKIFQLVLQVKVW